MFIFIFIFFPLTIFCQFKEEVVITASPYKTTLEELKNHTELIEEDKIKQKESLDEVLRSFSSSFILRNGSPGKVSSLFLRGSESNHTLLLLEGIPLNDPYFGNIYISEYLGNSFSKIEILKGPYSSIFGSEALGGVISLFLNKEKRGFFKLGFGNYGFKDFNLSYGNENFSLNFSKHMEEGRMENDGWDENQGFFYLNGKTLNFFIFGRKGKVEIPFNGPYITPLRNQETEDYLFSIPFEKNFKNNWNLQGSIGFLNSNFYFEDPEDLWGYKWGKTKSQRIFGNLKLFKSFKNFHFSAGIEAKEERVWDENVFGKNLEGEKFENGSIFFQGKREFKNFILFAGLRYDKSKNFIDSFNPKLGIFIPLKNFNFYFQAGTGFRAPSIGEIYFPYSGNKDLKEEKLKSFEAGFSYKGFKINFFKNNFKNLIDFDFLSYKFKNIGKAETKGIEVSYKNSFVFSSINYLKTRDLINNQELLRRPNFYGNFCFFKKIDVFTFNFITIFAGKRYDINENFERLKMDGFLREDFSLKFDLKSFGLDIKIENLFNSIYEEVYGYKSLGRKLVIGIEKNF